MVFRDSFGVEVKEGDYVGFAIGFDKIAPAKVLKLTSIVDQNNLPTALLSIEISKPAMPTGQLPGVIKLPMPDRPAEIKV
jgi:hypothetical protein